MKNTVLIIFSILLIGCSEAGKTDVSQQKMVDVLYDLTVSSSARSTANKRDTLQYVVLYEDILKKHGLDSLKYIKAQKVYQQDPDTYAAIYDSVYQRIQKNLEKVRATKPDKEEEEVKVSPTISVKDLPFSRRKNNN